MAKNRYYGPDIHKITGQNIADRRRLLGKSRRELAIELQQNEDWVRRIENGQTLPAYVLPLIAQALRIDDPYQLLEKDAFED